MASVYRGVTPEVHVPAAWKACDCAGHAEGSSNGVPHQSLFVLSSLRSFGTLPRIAFFLFFFQSFRGRLPSLPDQKKVSLTYTLVLVSTVADSESILIDQRIPTILISSTSIDSQSFKILWLSNDIGLFFRCTVIQSSVYCLDAK